MPARAPRTWILLRGLAREAGHWGFFLSDLQAQFPDDEFLPLDLPGAGEFLNMKSPQTVTGMFNFVRGLAISRAHRSERFGVIAVSLGGMVAMEWMRQRPEDLAAVYLVNTSSSQLSPFYSRLRWQIYPTFLKLMAITTAREREQAILELLLNSEEARAAALPVWTKIAIERPMGYLNFLSQLYAASQFKGLEKDPGVPTLILNGLGDRLVDPSCSTVLNQKFRWPISRHPWAGHDLPWDDPQWTIEKMTHFDRALTSN